MRLLWISIICLSVGIVRSRLCPDGKFCNGGACCPRYFISGPIYECCSFGCGILGGCSQVQNARPKRPKIDKGSLIDRDFPLDRNYYDMMDMLSMESIDLGNFIPSSIDSNFDSSETQNARSKRPKPKVDKDSLIDREIPLDRDNFVPPSDLMDMLSMESILDSPGSQNARSKRPKIDKGSLIDRDFPLDRDNYVPPSDLMDMLSMESILDSPGAQNARSKRPKIDKGSLIDRDFPLDRDNYVPPSDLMDMLSMKSIFDSSGAQNARSKRPKIDKGSLIDRDFPLDRNNFLSPSDLMDMLSMESILDSSGAQKGRSKRPKPKVDRDSLIDWKNPLDRDDSIPLSDPMDMLYAESIDWENFIPPSESKDFQMSWWTRFRDKVVDKTKNIVKEKFNKIKDAIIDSI